MQTKYIIFRLMQGLWNAVHVNIDTQEIADRLLNKLKAENPQHKFRVMQTTEQVVYEDR
jgi:hypothetical protein